VIRRGRHNLLGVLVDAVDYAAAVETIVQAAERPAPCAVSALAVHGVMTGYLDEAQRARLNHLDLNVPDGQPVRWALNLLHRTQLSDRVYGPTLMLRVCEAAVEHKLPIYLYGSHGDVLEALRTRLQTRFPELTIAGSEPSRFRTLDAAEKRATVERIRASGARITFVGLGCPRQEVWAYEYREALSMPIIAVGAAFDFHAGLLRQAPRWMQDHGLEWLFRLAAEPARLWRRYLLLNPRYVVLVGAQYARLRRFSTTVRVDPPEISHG
jgi:exopolysaccharide biosynthesis WecB/TagA/CpsF family protein